MRQFILSVSYDGTRYRGWQKQHNTSNTIQAKLSQVIERAFSQPIDLQGASRTDSGVHAIDQKATFQLDTILSCDEIRGTINQYLPEDIAVLHCEEVPLSFHVRHKAIDKTYRYAIWESDKPDVFCRAYEWTVAGPLDVELMEQALQVLKGKHDFKGFTVGTATKKTIRTITQVGIRVTPSEQGRRIELSFIGDGFLHHMIRLIVGSLVAIGRGETEADRLSAVLNSGNRSLAILAPPQGLCLMEVRYDPQV